MREVSRLNGTFFSEGFVKGKPKQGVLQVVGGLEEAQSLLLRTQSYLNLSDGKMSKKVQVSKQFVEFCGTFYIGDLVRCEIEQINPQTLYLSNIELISLPKDVQKEPQKAVNFPQVVIPQNENAHNNMQFNIPTGDNGSQELEEDRGFLRKRDVSEFNRILDLRPGDESFVIKARVVAKIIPKDDGQGARFPLKVYLKDETDTIAAIFWKNKEKISEKLQENRVFSFGQGKVFMANSRFSELQNPYEIVFNGDADIKEIETGDWVEGGEEGEGRDYRKCLIQDAKLRTDGRFVQLQAWVLSLGKVRNFGTSPNWKKIREVVVGDEKRETIVVKFWEEDTAFPLEEGQMYVFEKLIVKSFNGKVSLNYGKCSQISKVLSPPPMPRFANVQPLPLKHPNVQAKTVSELLSLTPENLKEGRHFLLLANLTKIGQRIHYQACSDQRCAKKFAVPTCPSCGARNEQPKNQLMSLFSFADYTGEFLAKCFKKELCLKVFGANMDLDALLEFQEQDERGFLEFLKSKRFIEYIIVVEAEKNSFEGIDEVSFTLNSISKLTSSESVSIANRLLKKLAN